MAIHGELKTIAVRNLYGLSDAERRPARFGSLSSVALQAPCADLITL